MRNRRRKNESGTRQEVNSVNQTLNSMRGLVEAARVPSTRRLITPAKAMAQVNELTRRTENVIGKVRNSKRQSFSDVDTEIPGRSTTHKRAVLRQVLSSQVRKFREHARRALVCASRANRREVLFALQKTGRNGNRNRKAVWTSLSYVSCKRRG